jgi:hypothetical protein
LLVSLPVFSLWNLRPCSYFENTRNVTIKSRCSVVISGTIKILENMHYPLGKYGAQLLTLGNLTALAVCVFELF